MAMIRSGSSAVDNEAYLQCVPVRTRNRARGCSVSNETVAIVLTQDDLRVVGQWAIGCVDRALPVFETHVPSDSRPREAVEGLKAFIDGGKRTGQLRSRGWAAWSAAREVGDPAASAAARAASLSAAI